MIFGVVAAIGAGLVYWYVAVAGGWRQLTVGDPDSTGDADHDQGAGIERDVAAHALSRGVLKPDREGVSIVLARLARPLMKGQRDRVLQAKLNSAGLSLKAHEYLAIQGACLLILGVLAQLRFHNLLFSLPIGAAGYFLPSVYLRRKQRQRRRAIEGQLADTVGLMANALQAGHAMQQALTGIAESGRKPIAEEIGRVLREINLGIPLEEALGHANTRLESKDFDMVVTAILIQRKVGGNLAEVLGLIAETVRERITVVAEVRVLTAQARASGYIVTGLPFAVAGILTLISPGFEKPLFTTPMGWGMVALSLIMISTGYAIIRKITDITL
jgi:tight adherence protein B